ncbi:hypothetical protein BDY19DRAFT_991889 [Irpex rosettiformis]|uniref:Uncharacterized protein n=1 Tax=Irpex rosettiformis TaxID=378272 RepID=A0ACB8UAI1_9APHY|nr:hypothetical protein BDY19DRAFT_991889 [Irpex rosettiformis]
MSNSSSSSYTPQDIAGLQAVQVGNFINVALMAVILYDCIIIFGEEVRLIWCYGSRGKNVVAASMLFLTNRYLAILYGVIGFVAGTVPLVLRPLSHHYRIDFSSVISAYRVYALQVWNHYLLATIVFLLNLVPFVVNLYAFVRYRPAVIGPSFSPCAVIDPLSPSLEIQYVYVHISLLFLLRADCLAVVRACRLSAIAADATVLLSTLAKTVPAWIEARKLKIAVPLSTAIIHDGSAYFFVLLLMNIFQMITFALWETEYLTTFIYVLTPVLSCRLILNLRQVNNQPGNPTLNSHILYQLDDQHAYDDKEMARPAFSGMNFDNLNLDAFDKIIASPSGSESSGSTSSHESPSLEDIELRDSNFKTLHVSNSSSGSSTEHSDRASIKWGTDI